MDIGIYCFWPWVLRLRPPQKIAPVRPQLMQRCDHAPMVHYRNGFLAGGTPPVAHPR